MAREPEDRPDLPAARIARGGSALTDIDARAIRANQDIYREAVRRSGGRVVESDGICLVHGAHPSWIVANSAFRTDVRIAAATVIERVTAAFDALDRRSVLMTFDGPDGDIDTELATTTWRTAVLLPVMIRRTPLPETRHPDGPALRWLDEAVAADLDDLRAVLRRGFAEDEEERDVIDSLFNGPEAIGGPAVDAVLAMLGGRPIACAMVYRVGDEAVVGWVATVPEARNRGLGGRLTMAVTNRGFDLGATLVTLQASPMGAPVYARLGYETIMPSRIWVGPKRL